MKGLSLEKQQKYNRKMLPIVSLRLTDHIRISVIFIPNIFFEIKSKSMNLSKYIYFCLLFLMVVFVY